MSLDYAKEMLEL